MRAALHVGSYCKGSVPLCREAQAERVGWWLARQLAAGSGGSIYLSGLPGTGGLLFVWLTVFVVLCCCVDGCGLWLYGEGGGD